jgi:Response regulator containing a CheY-like receiver domain and a GGDEF domain
MDIKKALVVDDSRLARIALTRMLEKRAIQVDTASSGGEALDYLKYERPDIIFMDYMMPDMDGFQTTKVISGNSNTTSIPVIMCTSQDTSEDRERAKVHGARGFITKPASEDSLDQILTSIAEFRKNGGAEEKKEAGSPTPAEVRAKEALAVTKVPQDAKVPGTVSEPTKMADSSIAEIARETAARVAEAIARQVIEEMAKGQFSGASPETIQEVQDTLRIEMDQRFATVLRRDQVSEVISPFVREQAEMVAQAVAARVATKISEEVAPGIARRHAEEIATRAAKRASGPSKWATLALWIVLAGVVAYLMVSAFI